MTARFQKTIENVTELKGFGLFTNADVRLRFYPAGENHGIVFQRTDLPGSRRIPATIEYLSPEERRTKLVRGEASVEMTEHLMAALAGLQIDNCLVQIDAPELPGCDGSALPYVEALLDAKIVTQTLKRETYIIQQSQTLQQDQTAISLAPSDSGLRLSYDLNYGNRSPIEPQVAEFVITPEIFATKIAPARTFILEQEIGYLRSKGYGQKVTLEDLLVYGQQGPIRNSLRAPNECARHKLLDCLGDLLLCGCDVQGEIRCFRSGHRQNHQLEREIKRLKNQSAMDRAA